MQSITSMPDLLIALVLALPVGLVLGLLGGGGSVLTVPLLLYGVGLEDKEAIATSLLVVSVTSVFAAVPHARAHHVRWRTAAIFGVAAMLGAYVGGNVAQFVPGPLLLLAFAIMMLVTAVKMWKGRKESKQREDAGTSAWKLPLIGLAVGFFTGLVGAGGGFLIVPALTLLGGLSIHDAVGSSLVVISANSIAGFAGYVTHIHIDYPLAALFIVGAVFGSLIGALFSARVSRERLRRGFAVFVAVMGVFIVVKELPKQLPQRSTVESMTVQLEPTEVSPRYKRGCRHVEELQLDPQGTKKTPRRSSVLCKGEPVLPSEVTRN